ncbi:MAG: CPBP family intramembrane metalloprotease, partial [Calditrichaeota bacterium]
RGRIPRAPRQKQIRVELKIIAALFSSLIFSWLHNVQSFNLLSYAPLYRLIMGILFCILYEFRGLGIVVWTHSLYDVFVILYR